MPEFYNYLVNGYSDDAVEFANGRWWIKMGFAGFNCQANNGFGFATKSDAERAIRRYQRKIK